MPIRPKTYNQAKHFLVALEIGDTVISNSTVMTSEMVIAYQFSNSYSKTFIETGLYNEKLSMRSIESLQNDFFIYWNSGINVDVEKFWNEVVKKKLPYSRKSPLRGLLNNGRLRSVEQWIDLYNSLEELKQLGFWNKQFSKKEIEQIEKLLEAEEKKKFELVNKCLNKKKIPFSQYLKFGESMAYLERCKLTLKYFTKTEREEILEIWTSTKL